MSEEWKAVFATHEEPQELATGDWLGDDYPGVALPSKGAIGKWVKIRYKDKVTYAKVMDVGPWCVDDDEYVFGASKPRAEQLKGGVCPLIRGGHRVDGLLSNGAGIDLFPGTAKDLGIKINDNVFLEWSFAWPW